MSLLASKITKQGVYKSRGYSTRTNAGLDNISTYRKMFFFEEPGERVITIMTAGSLSVTQTTIARLREAVEEPEASAETSIMLAPTMLKVAVIIGATLAAVRREVDEKLSAMNQGASASMIVAAQENFHHSRDTTSHCDTVGERAASTPSLGVSRISAFFIQDVNASSAMPGS